MSTPQDVIATALLGGGAVDAVAARALDALTAAGYAVVDAADRERDMAAIAEWQRSAPAVIEAANQFLLDTVTGDGNPTALASALIAGGFDGRFPTALRDAGHALVRLAEPSARGQSGQVWRFGAGADSMFVEASQGRVYFDDLDVTDHAEPIAGALIAAAQAVQR